MKTKLDQYVEIYSFIPRSPFPIKAVTESSLIQKYPYWLLPNVLISGLQFFYHWMPPRTVKLPQQELEPLSHLHVTTMHV